VTFSAPRAGFVAIYLATKPDRAPDGSFLPANLRVTASPSPAELQSGTWVDPTEVDPGTYYVMVQARPNFDSCFVSAGVFDPACADGFSSVLTLVVEKPTVHYSVRVRVFRRQGEAILDLTATPLGERLPYRVCYLTNKRAKRCRTGKIEGSSWDSPARAALYVPTESLPAVATFTWYVQGKRVASRRVRLH
jgi:hypothetical protein